MKKLLLILSTILPLHLFAFSPFAIDQSKIDFLSSEPFTIVDIKDGKIHEWDAEDKTKSIYGVFIMAIPNYPIYAVECAGNDSKHYINNTLENFRTQKKEWQFYDPINVQPMDGYTNNPTRSTTANEIPISFFLVSATNDNDEQYLIESLPNFGGWLF